VNILAAGSFNLCEFAIANFTAATSSAASTANLTENYSLNSAQNAGKKIYAQAAATNASCENTSISTNTEKRLSSNLIRSKSKIQYSEKNKKINLKSSSTSTFSYKERRLILLNSKNSNFNSIKTRDKINREFQK
jgi:hypothetical protein